jgi:two-component system cell cycle response regulator
MRANDDKQGDSLFLDETSVKESDTLKLKLNQARKSPPCLVIIHGKPLGRQFILDTGPKVIGRKAGCEILVRDRSVSKVHAEISRDEKENLFITDMNSTNGTAVNNKILEPNTAFPLSDGDFLKLGNVVLKFTAGGKIDNVFYQAISDLANRDELTGVLNRKGIMYALDEQFDNARVVGEPFSVIMLDFDNFKSVNDKFGHAAGDFVLKETGRILESAIRSNDFVGRFGGDEFLLLLVNTSLSIACEVAERVRSQIRGREFFFEGNKISLTVSLGISSLDSSILSGSDLFKVADMAHYNAKRRGGDRVEAD